MAEDYLFDPQKTALENFFALIYRRNRLKLHPEDVEVTEPQVLTGDPDGDNTTVTIKSLPTSRFYGEEPLYYARADIGSHYPDFQIDAAELPEVVDKASLMAYLDNHFDLVDGEVDLDLADPVGSLLQYTAIDLVARDKSLIYIGRKTIDVFWSGGSRLTTSTGAIRTTEEGSVRIMEL